MTMTVSLVYTSACLTTDNGVAGSIPGLGLERGSPSLVRIVGLLPGDLCSGFLRPKKSIDLSWIWTREPWISRRARYPEITEADNLKH